MSRAHSRKAERTLAIKDQLDLFAAPVAKSATHSTSPSSQVVATQPAERIAATSSPVQSETVGIDRRLIDFVTGTQRKRGRPPRTLESAAPKVDDGKRLLDVREAAARLGLSKSTLDKMRCSGRGPRYIRATDRAVRYDPADLAAFADGRRRRSTSEEAIAAFSE